MGRRLRNELPMMESLLQPNNNNQQRISKYLMKTKEEQKKYHDQHASQELEEPQPGTKVRLEPWTNSKQWKPATVVRCDHTPRSYVVEAEGGRKYRHNRQHLRVFPAPGYGRLHEEQSAVPASDKEPPRNGKSDPPVTPATMKPNQPTVPSTVNPDALRPPEQQPGPPTKSLSPYVTRSGRQVVKPKRFRL